MSFEDPFGPQASSIFNCTSTYCWRGEQGAGLLQADSASRLPASPRASSGCRQGSRQGGLQGSQNVSAAQPPPTHGSTSTSVSRWYRVLPCFGGDSPLQHLRHGVRTAAWHCLSPTAAWGLTVWARIWSHRGHGGLHVPGAGGSDWAVTWLPARLGETRVTCEKRVWGNRISPACCSCPPCCPGTPTW